MKIAIFAETYEPYVSGVTTSIKALENTLKAIGHEVYIVTANLEDNKFKYDEANKIIYIPGINTGISGTKLTNIYSRKAMKIIKTWNLDIIHSQTEFGIGAFSRIVSKKLNIPIVHTYHTLYEDYVHYVTHGHFDKLGKKLAVKLTKYYCEKTCDELIVPTDKIKKLFVEKYGIKKEIHVIPTGIDLSKFACDENTEKTITKLRKKYGIKKDEFVIGTISRIAKEKSLDRLLNSAKELIEYNSKIKLVVVGDGPELDYLKGLVKKLDIEENVVFTGMVDYTMVPSHYHLFDIMVSFSTTETQGLTIIEALASRLPVLCINDKSFREMVQDKYNGYLFEDEEDFIKKVKYLMKHNDEYETMALNAKNSVFKYSKEVFAAEVLKVYAKAIDNRKSTN